MGSRLLKLTIIAIASFTGGLRALTHSFEIRQSQQPATCTYKTTKFKHYPTGGTNHDYVFSIYLPGTAWVQVCTEAAMNPLLEAVKSRCHEIWGRQGVHKFIRNPHKAVLEEGQCHVSITVRVMRPKEDYGFPIFEDDCIWDRKPDFPSIGLDPENFPWPSMCFNAEIPEPAPKPKDSNYTPEHDQLLIELAENGLSWKQIAANHFPGWNTVALKERYEFLLKERAGPLEPGPKGPRCTYARSKIATEGYVVELTLDQSWQHLCLERHNFKKMLWAGHDDFEIMTVAGPMWIEEWDTCYFKYRLRAKSSAQIAEPRPEPLGDLDRSLHCLAEQFDLTPVEKCVEVPLYKKTLTKALNDYIRAQSRRPMPHLIRLEDRLP